MKKVSKKTVKKQTKNSKVSPKKFKKVTVKRYVRKIKVHNKIKAVVVHRHIRKIKIRKPKSTKIAKPSKIKKPIVKQAKPKVIIKQAKPKVVTKPIIKTVYVENDYDDGFDVPKGKFSLLDVVRIIMVIVFMLYAVALIWTSIYALIYIDGFRTTDKIWIPITVIVAANILFTAPFFLAKDYKKHKSLRVIHIIFVILFCIVGALLISIGVLQFIKPEIKELLGQKNIIIPILNCIFGTLLLGSPVFVLK